MKKRIAGLVMTSLAIVLSLGVTVCAAGSSSTTTSNVNKDTLDKAVGEVASAGAAFYDESGKALDVELRVSAIDIETVAEAEDAAAKAGVSQKQYGLVTGFDLGAVYKGTDKYVTSAKVRFHVPGVSASGNYVVMHYANNAWEVLYPEKTENGYLTVKFNSFSPVVVIETSASNAKPVTSPKTGETFPIAGVMAAICLAGAAFGARKVRMY